MAESKKSFILYTDLIHTVKKMPREKAGDLLVVILEYVNDLHPVVDDILVDLVFEPIKQQLKRDLQRWEDEKGVKSQNGIIGNLKRWHLDLYQQYIEDKITLEEAVNIANSRKPSQPDEEPSQPSQGIANIAVNVNGNVSDTVNGTKVDSVGSPVSTPTDGTLNDNDKCQLFVKAFNAKKRNGDKPGEYQSTTKVCSALKQRLRKYNSKQLLSVLDEALKDELVERRFITPEYVLRESIIERYLNGQQQAPTTKPKNYVP